MTRNDWDDEIIVEDDVPVLRPYIVSGANTAPARSVAIETLVEARGTAETGLRFERQDILDLAERPVSVAEVSASLNMPIGTTMVLVGELIETGHLHPHETTSSSELSDLNIMTRIINRVREL